MRLKKRQMKLRKRMMKPLMIHIPLRLGRLLQTLRPRVTVTRRKEMMLTGCMPHLKKALKVKVVLKIKRSMPTMK